jgi:hypothetical protein
VKAFYVVAPNRGHQGSVPATRQCTAVYSIIHQTIFVSTSNHCIAACTVFSRFVILQYNQYNDNQAIQSWQNSCVAFQQVLARTTSKTSTNAGSGILMKEEAFQRKSLAPECKNTIHIFIPSVLELYTHRLYFKIMQDMQVIWCCIRITNHWSSWSNSKGINYHLTQLMYIYIYYYGNMFLKQYVHLQANNIRFKKILYTTAFKDINNWDINFTLNPIHFYDKCAMRNCLVWLFYTCNCFSVFVIICLGEMVKYVEFLCYL